MIHASDWIIFLENGIPPEELPISEEHLQYCLLWLKKKEIQSAVTDSDFSNYPSCVYHRSDIWSLH